MIYTVTFNPSLDYVVSVKDFHLGMTNRTEEEALIPGGKGLNVSTVLKNLGVESTALGFTAGFVGDEIKRRVQECGLKSEFIDIKCGCSRINVKLKNVDGTEINAGGPEIAEKHVEMLLERLSELEDGDILVLAGSIPSSMSNQTYSIIMDSLKEKNITIVVDATGNLLLNVLQYKPFLIKPNHHELGEIYNVKIVSKDDAVSYAKRLQDAGARNVLVSMGAEGAVLLAEDGFVYKADSPKGEVVNSVGAGDSMVAGFICGWLEHKGYEYALRMGIAAGSASAFSNELATKSKVEEILRQLGE
ncbi:MAG: 1-phosphofructokinase [Lachnospiraceae bacterium]|nr:1-phosphofructokinase [Lachnospiraceae bacterium]